MIVKQKEGKGVVRGEPHFEEQLFARERVTSLSFMQDHTFPFSLTPWKNMRASIVGALANCAQTEVEWFGAHGLAHWTIQLSVQLTSEGFNRILAFVYCPTKTTPMSRKPDRGYVITMLHSVMSIFEVNQNRSSIERTQASCLSFINSRYHTRMSFFPNWIIPGCVTSCGNPCSSLLHGCRMLLQFLTTPLVSPASSRLAKRYSGALMTKRNVRAGTT